MSSGRVLPITMSRLLCIVRLISSLTTSGFGLDLDISFFKRSVFLCDDTLSSQSMVKAAYACFCGSSFSLFGVGASSLCCFLLIFWHFVYKYCFQEFYNNRHDVDSSNKKLPTYTFLQKTVLSKEGFSNDLAVRHRRHLNMATQRGA